MPDMIIKDRSDLVGVVGVVLQPMSEPLRQALHPLKIQPEFVGRDLDGFLPGVLSVHVWHLFFSRLFLRHSSSLQPYTREGCRTRAARRTAGVARA